MPELMSLPRHHPPLLALSGSLGQDTLYGNLSDNDRTSKAKTGDVFINFVSHLIKMNILIIKVNTITFY